MARETAAELRHKLAEARIAQLAAETRARKAEDECEAARLAAQRARKRLADARRLADTERRALVLVLGNVTTKGGA